MKNENEEILEELKELYPDLSGLIDHKKKKPVEEDFYGLIESTNMDVYAGIKERFNLAIKKISNIVKEEHDNVKKEIKIFVLMNNNSYDRLEKVIDELIIDKDNIIIDTKLDNGQIKFLLFTNNEELYHKYETKNHIPSKNEESVQIVNGIRKIVLDNLKKRNYDFIEDESKNDLAELKEIINNYNIPTRNGANHTSKRELVDAIKNHFNSKG